MLIRMPRWTLSVFVVLSLIGMSALCAAAPITYFGQDAANVDLTNSNAVRANFVATLSSFAVESMEGFANNQTDPTLFAGTMFQATSNFDRVVAAAAFSVSPLNALLDQGPTSEQGPAFNDIVQFSQPITAFGSYFAQGGDRAQPNSLTLRLENTGLGTSKDVTVTLGPLAPFLNVFFYGVTDTDPFDRVLMVESDDFDGILLDDTIAGIVVPEASTLVILAVGCVGMAVAALRRRFGPGRS